MGLHQGIHVQPCKNMHHHDAGEIFWGVYQADMGREWLVTCGFFIYIARGGREEGRGVSVPSGAARGGLCDHTGVTEWPQERGFIATMQLQGGAVQRGCFT